MKAFLITFSQTVRVILKGDEPTDEELEEAFVKASESMNENNVMAMTTCVEDKKCPYGEHEEDEGGVYG